MDREQEDMQFLGLFGIYKEAYKIIISCRTIFSKITLVLIIPLAFIFLAQIEITSLIFNNIWETEWQIYRNRADPQKEHKLSDHLSSEWTLYYIFRAVYYTFLLIFSLLSTSAVVYTVACMYTARDVTFKKVMSVVPKVWKRLMVTFVCAFIAFFLYHIVALLGFILWAVTLGDTNAGAPVLILYLILFIVGFVYLTIIWHLASVVTVLEDSYGLKAMMKSRQLIKGKMIVALIIFFKLNFFLLVIQHLFYYHVVRGYRYHWIPMWSRVLYGLLCLLLLFQLILFGLVVQTIIYFVCKSYHHENIDKSTLSDHLEVYLGDYLPLTAKDVQLEQFE